MFHCTGIFIMSVEHVLHKINSFWNFYYIIHFLRNKYYRGTSVPSHNQGCNGKRNGNGNGKKCSNALSE